MAAPKTRREARLRNYFMKQDTFYPISQWPQWVQNDVTLEHKTNRNRYNLFFFFASNGLDPEVAKDWVLAVDATGDTLIQGAYDAKTDYQMNRQLVPQAYAGTLWKGRKMMMDMVMGKVIKM